MIALGRAGFQWRVGDLGVHGDGVAGGRDVHLVDGAVDVYGAWFDERPGVHVHGARDQRGGEQCRVGAVGRHDERLSTRCASQVGDSADLPGPEPVSVRRDRDRERGRTRLEDLQPAHPKRRELHPSDQRQVRGHRRTAADRDRQRRVHHTGQHDHHRQGLHARTRRDQELGRNHHRHHRVNPRRDPNRDLHRPLPHPNHQGRPSRRQSHPHLVS